MSGLVGRRLIAVAALLLTAWFLVLARDQWVGNRTVHRIVTSRATSLPQWRAAEHDFDRARLLDPSADWSIIKAQYQLLYDKRAAQRSAEQIVSREPDNLAGWWVVFRAAKGLDDASYERAATAIRRLNRNPESN